MESRAAVLTAPARFELQAREPAAPSGRQVLIRLEGCGVCASNLPVWQGRPWFSYPLAAGAPGHEGWGRVAALGEQVHELAVGDRVALLCGNAFSQHGVTEPESVVKLPRELEDLPFPGEPLACALNIFRRSEIQPGQTVAIVGIGFLGGLLTWLAARAGADVIAFSRRHFSLEFAARMGARTLIQVRDPSRTLQAFRRLRAGKGCDRVIEAIGSQEALDLATELAAVRARLIIAGYHQDGPRKVDLQQWNWRGLDIINAHERAPEHYVRGMQEAIGLVARGDLDLSALFTHQFALDELSAAFEMLEKRPPGFVKALISCQ